MQLRPRLVVVLAAVFAGLTTLLVVVSAATRSPFAFLAALPLGLTAAVMWYQASGRMAARARRAASERSGGSSGARSGPFGGRGGFRTGRRRPGPGPGADGASGEGTGRWSAGRWFVDDAGRRWFVDGDGRRWAVGPDGRRWRADAAGGGGAGRRWQDVGPGDDGPTAREAYRVLDLEPGADEEQVRAAYREKVKAVHPDADDGDAEAFKRVTAAYERLTG